MTCSWFFILQLSQDARSNKHQMLVSVSYDSHFLRKYFTGTFPVSIVSILTTYIYRQLARAAPVNDVCEPRCGHPCFITYYLFTIIAQDPFNIIGAQALRLFNLLKPTGLRDAPTGLTFNNCVLCPHCICVFCIHLRTNSDLRHLQHKMIGFYNRDEKCLQRGTDWVFK